MHYLYADFGEYEKFTKPEAKFREMSIAGVQTISFKRLDDAINYRSENDGNFTFFEGDHPQVLDFWAFFKREQEQTERDARLYREQQHSTGHR